MWAVSDLILVWVISQSLKLGENNGSRSMIVSFRVSSMLTSFNFEYRIVDNAEQRDVIRRAQHG